VGGALERGRQEQSTVLGSWKDYDLNRDDCGWNDGERVKEEEGNLNLLIIITTSDIMLLQELSSGLCNHPVPLTSLRLWLDPYSLTQVKEEGGRL